MEIPSPPQGTRKVLNYMKYLQKKTKQNKKQHFVENRMKKKKKKMNKEENKEMKKNCNRNANGIVMQQYNCCGGVGEDEFKPVYIDFQLLPLILTQLQLHTTVWSM